MIHSLSSIYFLACLGVAGPAQPEGPDAGASSGDEPVYVSVHGVPEGSEDEAREPSRSRSRVSWSGGGMIMTRGELVATPPPTAARR